LNNPYKVLQVDPSAEQEVIEAAYRRLARKYHPDVNPDPEAAARMRDLTAAYGILRDPVRRAAFDQQRATAPWSRWHGRPAPGATPPEPPPPPPPPAEPAPGDGTRGPWRERRACSRHPGRPAVGVCGVCGNSLCGWCASLFQPAGCASCVWRRAGRAQRRAVMAIVAFLAIFVLVLDVAVVQLQTPLLVGLLAAYLVSATVLGVAVMAGRMWRSGWQDEPREWGFGVTFLVWAGLVVGWAGAPVLLGKMAMDFMRGRRLAALARNVLDVT
jgi:hypothetical protein